MAYYKYPFFPTAVQKAFFLFPWAPRTILNARTTGRDMRKKISEKVLLPKEQRSCSMGDHKTEAEVIYTKWLVVICGEQLVLRCMDVQLPKPCSIFTMVSNNSVAPTAFSKTKAPLGQTAFRHLAGEKKSEPCSIPVSIMILVAGLLQKTEIMLLTSFVKCAEVA